MAGGSPVLGGVQTNTTQTEGVYVKHIDIGAKIGFYEEKGNTRIIEVNAPKAVDYLYFSFAEKNFIMKLNDVKVDTNSTSIFNLKQPDSTQNMFLDSNSFFIGLSNIFFVVFAFILF